MRLDSAKKAPNAPLLAAAATRLRGRPGRPPKVPRSEDALALHAAQRAEVCVPRLSPLSPRLLDLPTAAGYLGVSPWTVRDLEAAGVLPRVRVPLPRGGELRKLLFAREDLDAVIARWKDGPGR